jgi:NAD(P)-dependent dehydrogenase (short-subunit alcohol dehydrogenase family)
MKAAGMTAIVTGGASGLGAAAARALALRGAHVTIFDINRANCEAIAQEIGGFAVGCDITDNNSTVEAFRKSQERHGPARIVVNCAGIAGAMRVVGKNGPHNLDLFRRIVEVNLIGSFNVLRLAAADMVALSPMADGERGVIINTASIAAFEGQIGQCAYAAAKAGIVGLTLPAARDLAKSGVRVMTIAPGLLETPMFSGLPQDAVEALAASTVFPARLGRPEEYGDMALHIVENILLNGSVVRLDGAIRLGMK